jgi:hypothetical protein
MGAFRTMEEYNVETIPKAPINQAAVEKWKVTKLIALA